MFLKISDVTTFKAACYMYANILQQMQMLHILYKSVIVRNMVSKT